MTDYLVTWESDIFDADSPKEAAKKAWDIMRKSGSTACVFNVCDEQGNIEKIDLLESDEEGEDAP